jgi:signal peptidase II
VLGRPARIFWLVAIATFLLDQASKSVVRALWGEPSNRIPWDSLTAARLAPAFQPFESLPIFGRVLMLTHVRNTGAAFGLLPGYQPFFIATSLAVLVFVAVYWRRTSPARWPVVVALGLVCGGAAGNLVDRAVLGKVTDYFYVALIDFPVFNVADAALVIGVGILIAWLLFGPEETGRTDSSSDSQPVEPGVAREEAER